MDINIKYGWIDKFGNKHLNNLKGFRENYLISSIESILKSGVGTCIEQAKLIKLFFDTVGFENKLFCWRGYETEDNFDKEVRMHCFVLYKVQDNWYHFEHSNFKKRGIHKYGTMENALETITGAYEKTDIRKLTEIPDIPDSITFKKFNNYVNSFDYKKNWFDIIVDNLTINKNDKISITGKSGQGKTTIINLILGNINAYKGTINIDSYDIK